MAPVLVSGQSKARAPREKSGFLWELKGALDEWSLGTVRCLGG
ncbi:4962_t:CDS:2 [Paraglomus occultum]|uniref:4962_t:CDS:1 n=1 Tax=Paraglomus occultum TaxID=144539 RepID=A0A9N8W5C4_9GLOM|nr:4962_t:CDS:2 [Paraglomus occultum]